MSEQRSANSTGSSRQPDQDSTRQPAVRRPVVFLDRDGTLNEELGYIFNVDDLVLLPDASESVAALNRARVACVVVTNQSGPARGFYSEEHVKKLNERLVRLLAEDRARVDAVYYCPHHPEGVVEQYAITCQCRKPAAGMIEKAFAEHEDLDSGRAYMVGDQSTDMDLARNARLKAVLVRTGFGTAVHEGRFQWQVEPDYVADSLAHAVDWILKDLGLG